VALLATIAAYLPAFGNEEYVENMATRRWRREMNSIVSKAELNFREGLDRREEQFKNPRCGCLVHVQIWLHASPVLASLIGEPVKYQTERLVRW